MDKKIETTDYKIGSVLSEIIRPKIPIIFLLVVSVSFLALSFFYFSSNQSHFKAGDNININKFLKIDSTKYKFSDYTSNEISNDHLRHMVGGRGGQSNISEKNERIFNGEFPEKPGALLEFLESFGNQWNISLFHYRNIGSAYGNILIGIEDTHKNKSALLKHLHKCGTAFKEESNNKAYLDFLK